MDLKVLGLNCTLKSGDAPSSTDKLLSEIIEAMRARAEISSEIVRVADHTIKPGVTSNEGQDDDWPTIRRKIIEADILVLGTPIWLGQPSSIAKRVLERLDAFLGETDDNSRMPAFGKVAVVAVVGNEDGAHHTFAALAQALNDVGFTIPANGMSYWVGEAMGSVDYRDLHVSPDKVRQTTAMLASNAVHLARRLRAAPYPGLPPGS